MSLLDTKAHRLYPSFHQRCSEYTLHRESKWLVALGLRKDGELGMELVDLDL